MSVEGTVLENAGQNAGAAGGGAGSSPPAGAGATPPAGGNAGAGGNGGAGAGSASWRDTLPPELKDNPILSKYSDVPNLAKAYIHAQGQISKKGAIVPGEKATPEEWQSFYEAIGVPSADKYEIKAPEGAQVNENAVKWLKETAAKNGVLPRQAAALLEGYLKFEQDGLKAMQQQKTAEVQKAVGDLKAEWGEAFDSNLQAGALFLKEMVGEADAKKLMSNPAIGNDAAVLRLFAKAAKLLDEDKLREGGVGGGRETKAEIQGQLDELRAQGNQNGLFDKNHPMHATTLAKLESLAKRLTGGR